MKADRARSLQDSEGFQNMPRSIRDWILESPNATADFAAFFEKSGEIQGEKDIKFASYAPGPPPKIYVNEATWHAVIKKDAAESMQYHLFGTLAHEIGHDRFNTATVPFKGTTAEEYVRYRSELEANAIFNAFPIFKDLENVPAFEYLPFNDIGYLHGFDLGQMYGQWRRGELDDQTAVDRMARKVPDAPYTLGNPPQDMNRDGALTHRDNYLQDFEQYVKPRLALQSSNPAALDDPNHPDHRSAPSMSPMVQGQTGAQAREYRFYPRTPEDDYLDAFLDAAERGDYAARQTLTEQYEQLPHVQAQQQQAREALLAEQQRLLEEQLRQEQERQRLMQQMQQEHSRSRGFSL